MGKLHPEDMYGYEGDTTPEALRRMMLTQSFGPGGPTEAQERLFADLGLMSADSKAAVQGLDIDSAGEHSEDPLVQAGHDMADDGVRPIIVEKPQTELGPINIDPDSDLE